MSIFATVMNILKLFHSGAIFSTETISIFVLPPFIVVTEGWSKHAILQV